MATFSLCPYMAFQVCVCASLGSICMSKFQLLIRTPDILDQGPLLRPHLNSNILEEGIFKYDHILRYWVLELWNMNFGNNSVHSTRACALYQTAAGQLCEDVPLIKRKNCIISQQGMSKKPSKQSVSKARRTLIKVFIFTSRNFVLAINATQYRSKQRKTMQGGLQILKNWMISAYPY